MSDAQLSRFDDLVSRYLDESLTAIDATELVAALAEPTLTARFLEATRLNSEIAGLLAAPVPDAAMVELVRADIGKSLAAEQPPRGAHLHLAEQPLAAIQPTVVARRLMPPRRKPVFPALAWAAVFLVFAGLATGFIFNRTRSGEAPAVISIQGDVRLIGPSGASILTRGNSWRRDEKLTTVGTSSAAVVKFHDGSQLDFGGNTVAINESSGDALRVQLDHGTVQAALKQQPARRSFLLATPEAEAIIVGTTLRLVTGSHHTRLDVTEGEVRFRRRHDGAEIAVKAGHYAVVSPNIPFIATPLHPEPHTVH